MSFNFPRLLTGFALTLIFVYSQLSPAYVNYDNEFKCWSVLEFAAKGGVSAIGEGPIIIPERGNSFNKDKANFKVIDHSGVALYETGGATIDWSGQTEYVFRDKVPTKTVTDKDGRSFTAVTPYKIIMDTTNATVIHALPFETASDKAKPNSVRLISKGSGVVDDKLRGKIQSYFTASIRQIEVQPHSYKELAKKYLDSYAGLETSEIAEKNLAACDAILKANGESGIAYSRLEGSSDNSAKASGFK